MFEILKGLNQLLAKPFRDSALNGDTLCLTVVELLNQLDVVKYHHFLDMDCHFLGHEKV